MIKIQPAPFVDQIKDGHEMTKLPYPFFVETDGMIGRQDLWQGDPFRAVGFQRDLAVQVINVWWDQVVDDPKLAVGMYLVTANAAGDYAVHTTAVASAEVID
jgi:hypothetical protein